MRAVVVATRDGRLDEARDDWVDEWPLHLRRPLHRAATTRPPPTMHAEDRDGYALECWSSSLTINDVRAGRIECEQRNGRDDDVAGLKVLRELEAGKRQDVRALPLSLASPGASTQHASRLTPYSGRPIAIHFLTLPNKVRRRNALLGATTPLTMRL
jgi:hypothetical protein